MKKTIFSILLTGLLLTNSVLGDTPPVKKSKSGICHIPGSHYYNQTKHFVPYKTLEECLRSGGRLPKK